MQENDPQRAFQFVVLLTAHVVDLLGEVERVSLGDAARAQQSGLLHRPTVKIAVIARRFGAAARRTLAYPVGRIVNHRNLLTPQLWARLVILPRWYPIAHPGSGRCTLEQV